jgi:hypothetical protein
LIFIHITDSKMKRIIGAVLYCADENLKKSLQTTKLLLFRQSHNFKIFDFLISSAATTIIIIAPTTSK